MSGVVRMGLRQAQAERGQDAVCYQSRLMLSLSKQLALAGVLMLSSCSQPEPEPPGERIACALDGATEFAEVCTLERDGPRFSLHRPDGGFRRFEPVAGQGIRSIDGVDAAVLVARDDGMTEVSVDGDRYLVQVVNPGGPPTPGGSE